jgi:hypothetical protein
MVFSIDEVLYWTIGSIGILVVVEVSLYLAVNRFNKIRQQALEEE